MKKRSTKNAENTELQNAGVEYAGGRDGMLTVMLKFNYNVS